MPKPPSSTPQEAQQVARWMLSGQVSPEAGACLLDLIGRDSQHPKLHSFRTLTQHLHTETGSRAETVYATILHAAQGVIHDHTTSYSH